MHTTIEKCCLQIKYPSEIFSMRALLDIEFEREELFEEVEDDQDFVDKEGK